jgi:hypothetical protein
MRPPSGIEFSFGSDSPHVRTTCLIRETARIEMEQREAISPNLLQQIYGHRKMRSRLAAVFSEKSLS